MKIKKEQVIKIAMLILFIIILIYMTIKIIPLFKDISTEEGRLNFKEKRKGFENHQVAIIY